MMTGAGRPSDRDMPEESCSVNEVEDIGRGNVSSLWDVTLN